MKLQLSETMVISSLKRGVFSAAAGTSLIMLLIGMTNSEASRGSCTALDNRPTVFEHASVITMRDSLVHHDFDLVARDGRIEWIGPSAKAPIPRNAFRIDARTRFLIPGLADMHVHMDAPDSLLFLAYGVTQVREMNGTRDLLSLRDRICSGKSLGPTMFVTGPLLAGVKQRWRHVLVETPDSAARVVTSEAADGYDAVKIYDGLSLPTYRAILSAAAAAHLPVVGHIPREVGLDTVLAYRQRSIEHVDQIFGSIAGHSSGDSALVDSIARVVSKGSSWITPTLAAEYALSRTGSTTYKSDLARPESVYVDAGTRSWWASLARPRTGAELSADEFGSARARQYFGFKQLFVREIDRLGVRMLAGTDTPNPLMIPGYSLQDEIAVLSRAGLGNYKALRAATQNAAEFLVQQSTFGTLRPGARADVVMLDSNPLVDLGTLKRPAGVMVRGRWLTRTELDAMQAKSQKPLE